MRLTLVRHAEPEWVRDGLAVDDPPLTERGWRQAERLAERLSTETFDEIVVSPLQRTRQTFAAIEDRTGWRGTITPWLEEIRSPIWHGTPAEKAEEAFKEERARIAKERWRGIEGGEAVRDFVARIRENAGLFLAERGVEPVTEDVESLPVWRVGDAERRVLVVAHAGTNSGIVAYLLGLAPVPWEWDRFVLNHASVTRIEPLQLGDGWTFGLSRLSDVEHLDEADRTL